MVLTSHKAHVSFGQASKTYDKYAVMQVVAANHLAQMLPKQLGKVLELGCGTGVMTDRLVAKHPNSLIISDASEAMLNIASKHYPQPIPAIIKAQKLTIDFIETIVTNMMLQWAENLTETVKYLSSHCNGLYFSVPLASSMLEWDSFCSVNKVQNCRRALPTLNDILSINSDTHDLKHSTSEFCLYYPSWLAFWQSQKLLGAHTSCTKALAPYNIRKELVSGPIKVTYNICCVAMEPEYRLSMQ